LGVGEGKSGSNAWSTGMSCNLHSVHMIRISLTKWKSKLFFFTFFRYLDVNFSFFFHQTLTFFSPCDQSLSGGYDDQANQVIICSNNCKTPEKVEEILSHELVHMYDYCTAKIDFSNPKHLACTEIRAATLTSCSKFTWDFWTFQGYKG